MYTTRPGVLLKLMIIVKFGTLIDLCMMLFLLNLGNPFVKNVIDTSEILYELYINEGIINSYFLN